MDTFNIVLFVGCLIFLIVYYYKQYKKWSSINLLPGNKRELIIPFQERARLLLDVGYSLEELGEATLSVYKIKKQREERKFAIK